MTKFKSKGTRMIYSRGYRIVFDENGEYTTDDPDEIAVLERSRNAELVRKAKTAPMRSKDAASHEQEDVQAVNYTRAELEALASRLGISNPGGYATKTELADAINRVPDRG